MNTVIISGKIYGDIYYEYTNDVSITKFKICNQKYNGTKGIMDRHIIRCICKGALADYVNTELYEGCNIIITGYISSKVFDVNNTKVDRTYLYCNTVSVLEQEEYS